MTIMVVIIFTVIHHKHTLLLINIAGLKFTTLNDTVEIPPLLRTLYLQFILKETIYSHLKILNSF